MKDYSIVRCARTMCSYNSTKPRRILDKKRVTKKNPPTLVLCEDGFLLMRSSRRWLDLVRILHIELRMQKTGLRSAALPDSDKDSRSR